MHNRNNIDTIDEKFAIQSFQTYGYFDLVNNYKNDIRIVQRTKQLTIEHLLAIREIDNDLQSLIFKYLIQIENTFKSRLSYLLAQEFGVSKDDYTDCTKYKNHIAARRVFNNIEGKKHIDFNKNPAKHYLNKYGDIPPWVYLKHIPLGDTKNIYKELKSIHKIEIIKGVMPFLDETDNFKMQCFKEHLDYIHDFRNSIAHGGKLLNYVSIKKVQPQHYTKILLKTVISNRDIHLYEKKLYQLLLTITILISDNYLREKFVAEIESLYQYFIQSKGNRFTDIFIEVSGLPDDFIFRLSEAIKSINILTKD